MGNEAVVGLFIAYILNDQWGFRFQRVGRGILLRALDTAAAYPHLFSRMMPPSYVASVWLGRLLWFICLIVGWQQWGGYVLLVLLAHTFVLGAWIDSISPWPSYQRFLHAISSRLERGEAGVEGLLLISTIDHIKSEMRSGAHFEAVTTDVWLKRDRNIQSHL